MKAGVVLARSRLGKRSRVVMSVEVVSRSRVNNLDIWTSD